MVRPYTDQMESTRVIYKPHLTVSLIHIAPLEHFKVSPKCKVTKQISTGLRVNIKEISKRRLPPHQIQQLERHCKLIKRPALKDGSKKVTPKWHLRYAPLQLQ